MRSVIGETCEQVQTWSLDQAVPRFAKTRRQKQQHLTVAKKDIS